MPARAVRRAATGIGAMCSGRASHFGDGGFHKRQPWKRRFRIRIGLACKRVALVMALALALVVSTAGARSAAQAPAGDATVLVKGLRFSGSAELLEERDKNEVLSRAVGARLGIDGILALADWVTLRLHQNGYLLAQAYVPPQDVTDGVIEIAVVEGHVERVVFDFAAGARVKEAFLRALADGTLDYGRLRRGDVETALRRMEGLPGVRARAYLEPGVSLGTTRLTFRVDEEPVLKAKASITNYGSPSTGRIQNAFGIALVDLTGWGDEVRFQAVTAQGTNLFQASASLPLGAMAALGALSPLSKLAPAGTSAAMGAFADTFARVHFSRLGYEVLDGAEGAGIAGTSSEWGLGIRRPLVRSRRANLFAEAGVAWRAMVDRSAAGVLADRRMQTWSLAFFGDVVDAGGGGVTEWNLKLNIGDLDLSGAPGNEAADAASLKTAGEFHSIGASLKRTWRLAGGWSLYAGVAGQWAGKNLDGSVEFSLGGPQGVRAYPVGEARGDEGALVNLELRYGPPAWRGVEFKAFVDAGFIRIHKQPGPLPFLNACGCNAYGLGGAGVGASVEFKNLAIEVAAAHALGENPGRSAAGGTNVDGRRDRWALWFSGSFRF